jgi:hypothetical protein
MEDQAGHTMKRRVFPPSRSVRSEWRAGWIMALLMIGLGLLRIAGFVIRFDGVVAGLVFLVVTTAALVLTIRWLIRRSSEHAEVARLSPCEGARASFKVHLAYSTDYAYQVGSLAPGRLDLFPDRIELRCIPRLRSIPDPISIALSDVLKVEADTGQAGAEIVEIFATNYVTVRAAALDGCGLVGAISAAVDGPPTEPDSRSGVGDTH